MVIGGKSPGEKRRFAAEGGEVGGPSLLDGNYAKPCSAVRYHMEGRKKGKTGEASYKPFRFHVTT